MSIARLRLTVNKNSRNIPDDLYDQIEHIAVNGLEIEARDYEEFPMPWDASARIEDNFFILEGYIGPSGIGECTTKIPLDRVSDYIDIYVTTGRGENEQSDIDQLDAIFDEYGWVI